jgi:RNA exonuclease 1
MGVASDKESELIRLTVVDYFSGKTLIDTLVYPSVPMQHFNTRWSGVTKSQIERARKQRRCIFGTTAARAAIFKYVGRETFVVGHGMQHDLLCLRWHHDRIVDSYLVESGIRKEAQMRAEEDRKRGIQATSPFLEIGQAEVRTGGGKMHPDGMSLKALCAEEARTLYPRGQGTR